MTELELELADIDIDIAERRFIVAHTSTLLFARTAQARPKVQRRAQIPMQLRVPALRPAPEDGADRGCPLPGGVFPSLGWESHLPGSQGGRHSGKQRSYPTGSPAQGCRGWGRGEHLRALHPRKAASRRS